MLQSENTCENCKNYFKHYIIHKNKLKVIGGHCGKPQIARYYQGKVFTPRQNCKHWAENKPDPEEGKERTIKEIKKIKNTLSEIALILKSE